MTLTALQAELLLTLYELQRQYAARDWSFDSTIWSKATFTLARAHNQLRPSPARNRHNVARPFEQRLNAARTRLKQLALATTKKIAGPDTPARYAQGYKRHKSRSTDLFLTQKGLQEAESRLRQKGLLAAPEKASCTTAPPPNTPTPTDLAGCD